MVAHGWEVWDLQGVQERFDCVELGFLSGRSDVTTHKNKLWARRERVHSVDCTSKVWEQSEVEIRERERVCVSRLRESEQKESPKREREYLKRERESRKRQRVSEKRGVSGERESPREIVFQ